MALTKVLPNFTVVNLIKPSSRDNLKATFQFWKMKYWPQLSLVQMAIMWRFQEQKINKLVARVKFSFSFQTLGYKDRTFDKVWPSYVK